MRRFEPSSGECERDVSELRSRSRVGLSVMVRVGASNSGRRSKYGPVPSALLVVLLSALVALPLGAGAQAGSSPAQVPSLALCDVSMNVQAVDARRVALRFFTSGSPRRVSGTAALYAGDRRYDVAFRDAYARSTKDDDGRVDVVPVVVRFPERVEIDGVVVTAIDALPQPACAQGATPFIPWKFPPSEMEGYRAFRARVDALPAIDAPPPVTLTHTCPVRNAHARVVAAAQPRGLSGGGNGGVAYVLVSLDASDRIVGVRIEDSSGDPEQDAIALQTARLSTYETEIFNCTKRANSYMFGVSF